MSSTEKEDLTKEFRLFDKNNDGFIDRKELKAVLQKILPKFQLPDAEIRRMISNVDTNNDGKIDYKGPRDRQNRLDSSRFFLFLEFVESIYPQLRALQ